MTKDSIGERRVQNRFFAVFGRLSVWRIAPALSGIILLATIFAGATLVPGSPLDGLTTAQVISAKPIRLDAAIYFYDGKRYSRVGRVVGSGGTRHRLKLLDDVVPQLDDGLVAAITPANISKFVKLQSSNDLAAMREDVGKMISSIVGELFSILRENRNSGTPQSSFQIAFRETLDSSSLEDSRTAISDFMQKKLSPRVSRELRILLFDRIKNALHVTLKDAFENYGTDLFRGRFETRPIVEAVDGILADPRMLDLVVAMQNELLDDPNVIEATRVFAAQYADKLFEDYSKLPSLPGNNTGPRTEALVRQFLSLIEDQIYRNDSAHPVVVAVASNVMKPERQRSDAILILTDKVQAADWSVTENTVTVWHGR